MLECLCASKSGSNHATMVTRGKAMSILHLRQMLFILVLQLYLCIVLALLKLVIRTVNFAQNLFLLGMPVGP